eukprot:3981142-Pleurochrysis_carterae.AAC.1
MEWKERWRHKTWKGGRLRELLLAAFQPSRNAHTEPSLIAQTDATRRDSASRAPNSSERSLPDIQIGFKKPALKHPA